MHKVEIINMRSIGTYCGVGYGRTIREAQDDAIRIARIMHSNGNARISESGWQVLVDEPVIL